MFKEKSLLKNLVIDDWDLEGIKSAIENLLVLETVIDHQCIGNDATEPSTTIASNSSNNASRGFLKPASYFA